MDKFTKEAEDMPALSVPCKTRLTKTWSPVHSAHEEETYLMLEANSMIVFANIFTHPCHFEILVTAFR
jgi:hypothetical protein